MPKRDRKGPDRGQPAGPLHHRRTERAQGRGGIAAAFRTSLALHQQGHRATGRSGEGNKRQGYQVTGAAGYPSDLSEGACAGRSIVLVSVRLLRCAAHRYRSPEHGTTIFQVDAFADGPFQGNPAAVCPSMPGWTTSVCGPSRKENNLSETAFVVGRDGDYRCAGSRRRSRWTCAVATTLATAWVLILSSTTLPRYCVSLPVAVS